MTAEDKDSFGTLLRAARLRAGFASIHAFADALAAHGLAYTDDAIGHWENDRRRPPRDALLPALELLAQRSGITHLAQVSRMLWLLDLRDLDDDERHTHFPTLLRTSFADNLPPHPGYARLVGRDALVADLLARVGDPSHAPVIVLSGLGGIGKTAVVYEVVSRALAGGMFTRLAWETTRSEAFTGVTVRIRRAQTVTPADVFASFARQLGLSGMDRLPPDAVQARLRDIVRAGGCLLVLDNLETLEAAQDVAEALYKLVSPARSSQPSKVFITSRERLADIPHIYDVFIPGLSEPAALELLALEAHTRGAESLLTADERLLQRIYTVTGGMPLALKLIVSQYLLGIALDTELDKLAQVTDREALYRFIYFSLWQKLSEPAQQVLVAAATFAASSSHDMLMRVARLDEHRFDQAIPELVRMSLVEVLHRPETRQQRYDIHPMTRWFVNAPLTEVWNRQQGRI